MRLPPSKLTKVKKWREECIIAKFKACHVIPKILKAVKVFQLSTELRVLIIMQCAYFRWFFFINWWSCSNFVFALSLWCMECRLMWEQSNSKQFIIRLQHNKREKRRGMKLWILFIGSGYIYLLLPSVELYYQTYYYICISFLHNIYI